MSHELALLPPLALDGGLLETITSALRRDGVVIVPDALPVPVLQRLLDRANQSDVDDFTTAGIGRLGNHRTTAAIRRDRIQWLDPDDAGARWYLAWAELLRSGLNRQLFLGLFDYEAHLAWYPEGAFYRTHLDTFATANPGRSERVISTVLYLNPDWQPGHGGELVIHPSIDGDSTGGSIQPATERIVEPAFGTLVLFLSAEFPHEVLPVTHPRYSLAGWFRTNALSERAVDPPVFELTGPDQPGGSGSLDR